MASRVSGLPFAMALATSVLGCGQPPADDVPTVLIGRAESRGFVLEASIPTASLTSSTPIVIDSALTWMGQAPTQHLGHDGANPVLLLVEEVGGGRVMGPSSDLMCDGSDYVRGVAIQHVPRKGGGWDAADPNADFYRAFLASPDLRLPAGRWRLTVLVMADLGQCGGPPVDPRVPFDIVIR